MNAMVDLILGHSGQDFGNRAKGKIVLPCPNNFF
jgi:hypothetical protein